MIPLGVPSCVDVVSSETMPCRGAVSDTAAAVSLPRFTTGALHLPFHGREGTTGSWLGAVPSGQHSSRLWFMSGAEDLQLKVCSFQAHGIGATACDASVKPPSLLRCDETWHAHPGSVQAMATTALSVDNSERGCVAGPAGGHGLIVTGGSADTLHCWSIVRRACSAGTDVATAGAGDGTLAAASADEMAVEWLCTKPFDETSTQDQRIKALAVFDLHTGGGAAGGVGDAGAARLEPHRFYAVVTGNSEGRLMLLLVDACSRCVVEVARFRENSKPVLSLQCVHPGVATTGADGSAGEARVATSSLLIVGATNGCISVWDLNPALDVAHTAAAMATGAHALNAALVQAARAELFGCAKPAAAAACGGYPQLLSVFQAHGMGVNCLDAAVAAHGGPSDSPARVVVASGGDGQGLVVTRFALRATAAGGVASAALSVEDVEMSLRAGVASAGLRGLQLRLRDSAGDDGGLVFLSGTDQRLTVWRFAARTRASDDGQWADIDWLGCTHVEVADISSLDVLQVCDGEFEALLVGAGAQCVRVHV